MEDEHVRQQRSVHEAPRDDGKGCADVADERVDPREEVCPRLAHRDGQQQRRVARPRAPLARAHQHQRIHSDVASLRRSAHAQVDCVKRKELRQRQKIRGSCVQLQLIRDRSIFRVHDEVQRQLHVDLRARLHEPVAQCRWIRNRAHRPRHVHRSMPAVLCVLVGCYDGEVCDACCCRRRAADKAAQNRQPAHAADYRVCHRRRIAFCAEVVTDR